MKRDCIVDLQQHVLLTQEGPVQFVSGPERSIQCSPVCFVISSETLNVPPYCQMWEGVTKCRSLHEQLQRSPGGTSVAVYEPAWSHGGSLHY